VPPEEPAEEDEEYKIKVGSFMLRESEYETAKRAVLVMTTRFQYR
jgi:hypothetical protein